MKTILLLAVAAMTLLPACEKSERHEPAQSAVTDTATDEQAIRASIARWHELIRSKNAEAIALLYAEDGELMAPGLAAISGREAVRQFWQSTVELPELTFTFEPREIEFARGGDLAIDRGTYRFQGKVDGKALDETGKYVVIWRKVGKDWKVAADIWNSDQPPPA